MITKGFLTLATGDERYFILATNLLKSYRLFSENPLPFAILTDRHNKYTEQFDEVIILKDASSSYMDKLSILVNIPFDETIFIDADCLAYQDLNQYWNVYDFKYSLTCFGIANPLEYKEGWFKKEDIGEYGNLIKFIPNMHGGVYFLKKNIQIIEMFNLALEINNNYSKYKFKYFVKPADEPILALCMAIFDCKPIEAKTGCEIVFYPTVSNLQANILTGSNRYESKGKIIENSWLIHWQNYFTKKAIYKAEIDKLNLLVNTNFKKKFSNKNINNLELYKIKIKMFYYRNRDSWENLKISIKKK